MQQKLPERNGTSFGRFVFLAAKLGSLGVSRPVAQCIAARKVQNKRYDNIDSSVI